MSEHIVNNMHRATCPTQALNATKFRTYADSLPLTCQSGLYLDLDIGLLTVRGQRFIQARQITVPDSIVRSRCWSDGMRPLLDLFNHNDNANFVLYFEMGHIIC